MSWELLLPFLGVSWCQSKHWVGLYPEAEPPFLPQTAPGHAGIGLGAPQPPAWSPGAFLSLMVEGRAGLAWPVGAVLLQTLLWWRAGGSRVCWKFVLCSTVQGQGLCLLGKGRGESLLRCRRKSVLANSNKILLISVNLFLF